MTATTMLVGGTADLADASAASARGAAAYFKYVNARGGVHGRSIVYRLADEGGDPLAATERLVEGGVFALFASVGAEQGAGVRDYLNAAEVPQLFVGSGATTLGSEQRRFPWTIGFEPSHRAEGWIYGSYLARARRGASIGVLLSDDDEGRDLLVGLRQGIARSTARVVAAQTVAPGDVEVESRVAALEAAGANVLALFIPSAREATRAAARLGWRPHVVSSTREEATERAVSIAWVKDPSDRSWNDDAAMRRYRSIMSRYARGANPADSRYVQGMAAAYELVRVLKAAGTEPTRAGVMAAVRRLNDSSNPFLLPGISVRTGSADRFPVEHAQLVRRSQGRWKSFGGLWAYRSG